MAEASIIFRNEDMSSTGRIYVGTKEGAGTLAARFRKASHWVDVINGQDEVAHRWEKGQPDRVAGDALYFHNGVSPFDFTRDGDGWWSPENRAQELSEMLAFAFDVAIGKENPNSEYCYIRCVAGPDWTLQNLVDEAEEVHRAVPKDDALTWAMAISDWMSDPDRLFVQYHAEFAALIIRFGLDVVNCRVWRLGVELAEAEVSLAGSEA